MLRTILIATFLGALTMPIASPAAKPKAAVCDFGDGARVPCAFEPINKDGSFHITDKDDLTYTFTRVGPDRMAVEYYNGARPVTNGIFLRDRRDRACWISRREKLRLCAW